MHLLFLLLFSSQACWQLVDHAMQHSAQAARAPFISYTVRANIAQDGSLLDSQVQHIDYRADGFARVTESGGHPMFTRTVEPGPPQIGPLAGGRSGWLAQGSDDLRDIASVRVEGSLHCTIAGTQTIGDHQIYHVTFPNAASDRPALKALWIDSATAEIRKMIVSGKINIQNLEPADRYADFEVTTQYVDPYLVVSSVTWTYDLLSNRPTLLCGRYEFTDYSFSESAPSEALAQEPL